MMFAHALLPDNGVEGRYTGIAIGFKMDFGELDAIGVIEKQPVNFSAADDRDIAVFSGDLQGVFATMGNFSTLRGPAAGAGQHYMVPPGQGLGEAFKCLASHDRRLAHGVGFESPEVGGDAPGHLAVLADHAIFGARQKEDDLRLGHTATGAAI